jgi:hypothetical protein
VTGVFMFVCAFGLCELACVSYIFGFGFTRADPLTID